MPLNKDRTVKKLRKLRKKKKQSLVDRHPEQADSVANEESERSSSSIFCDRPCGSLQIKVGAGVQECKMEYIKV